jgi:hypothetical protein
MSDEIPHVAAGRLQPSASYSFTIRLPLVAAGTALAPQATLHSAPADAARLEN